MKKLKFKRTHLDLDEIKWAAGFFDGEGCTSVSKRNTHGRPYKYPTISLAQAEPIVLERFNAAVGNLTNMIGPYSNANGTKLLWLHYHSYEKAQAVIAMLWNYLSLPKKLQATRVFKECKAWDKTHVPNYRQLVTCENCGRETTKLAYSRHHKKCCK